MIRTGYNKGPSWWCDQCDRYHNGYLWMTLWTAGKPPKYCIKCEVEMFILDAREILKSLYPQKIVFPATTRIVRHLLEQHRLIPHGIDPRRFAAMVNQYPKR